MKQKRGRRSFLKNLSAAGATALLPAEILKASPGDGSVSPSEKIINGKETGRKYNEDYTGAYLNRIAFPIGGMGAGMFCMEGTGAISHMSTRNKPAIFNTPAVFADISIKGFT